MAVPIGLEQISTLLQDALDALQLQAEQLGLDTHLTEALTQSEFTEMATSPIQTTSDLMRTLTPIFAHFTRAGLEPRDIALMQAEALNAVSKDIKWLVLPYGKSGYKIQAKLSPQDTEQ